jgi:hypothetical protein
MIGMMILAILYGAYELLLKGQKNPVTAGKATSTIDLAAFVNEINAAMSKEAPSPTDSHIMKRGEAAWLRDPFLDRKRYRDLVLSPDPAPAAKAAAPATKRVRFHYTGYVDVGHKRIAIVNGNEYAKGDALDVEGYVLTGITPSKITVYHKESQRTLEIPLQE